MNKKFIISACLFLSVVLIFITGFSFVGQKQIRYVLDKFGVETDDEHFYLGGIPISLNIYEYDSSSNELEINPDAVGDDVQKYLKIHENSPDEWSLEQWYEVRELTRSANTRIINANLNGIKSTITFSQKVSKDDLEEFVSTYGLKNYRYKVVYTTEENAEPYCYGIGLLIKDSETLQLAESDERVFMVDTFVDLFHIGRNQKNEIERNGVEVDKDFANEWGKDLCTALQSKKD